MQAAPIPFNETQRLNELYSYEVLDTETEKALDDIVQAAASICGTTFGALSLIDRDRQWFKAQCGFSLRETMRSHSVCGHGILSRAFFEVPDTRADVRFSDNQVLETLGVRFYGGTQLIGSEGHVLGMLCVLDPEPRQLSASQQAQLTTLAIRAMELLEAHRQRRRMEWLGALVSQVPDEIYLFDLNTHLLLHANEAASQNGQADLAGLDIEDVTPEITANQMAAYMRQLREGAAEVVYDTWIARPADQSGHPGGRRPVEARWQRLKTSGHPLVMCTLRDMTQRLQLDKAKDEFIAVASHELRTPLTGLYGAIKLLESGACGALSPAATSMIKVSSRTVDDLLKLVNDILDLEKNTAGLMTFEIAPVEVQPLMDSLICAHAGAAVAAGVRMVNAASAPVTVMADAQRLRQILGNLISNALKFAPPATTITLDAFSQPNGKVRLAVRDQGPGVPPDFQSKLFQRFSQATSMSERRATGSGLGLSIVKSMTEGMGGTVACQSRPGCTEFSLELPQGVQAPHAFKRA